MIIWYNLLFCAYASKIGALEIRYEHFKNAELGKKAIFELPSIYYLKYKTTSRRNKSTAVYDYIARVYN